MTAQVGASTAAVPDDYNPTIRPDSPGVATPVSIGIFLLDLAAIDDLSQEFTVDVYLTASWRDGRLADSESGEDRLMPLDAIWDPALGALNRRAMSSYLPNVARVDSEGNVFAAQRLFGAFSSPLDLHLFPADVQVLPMRFASYRYGPDELELRIDERRTGRLPDLSVVGWKIGDSESDAEPLEVPGATRAGASFQVRAQRETTYYFLTMALPLLLIALMAWTALWIDPSFLPSKVGVSTASVFTLIAFRFSLKLSLPKVSYLTTADWMILAVTLLVFAALGVVVLTGGLAKSEREEQARRIERWARSIYLVVLVLLCIYNL